MTPRFHLVGDGALSVEWPLNNQANRLARALAEDLAARTLPGVQECVPALRSLLIRFDPQTIDPEGLEREISLRLQGLGTAAGKTERLIRIPICFDADLAPDLDGLAKAKGITREEAIARLTSACYTALFMGFLPGFAYLDGLPPELSLPRLATPRTLVPAGSLALADGMCAVYPLPSPGGWHLLGRTPMKLFDPEQADPFLLRAGDQLSFFAVRRAEFEGGR
ncbi:MAG: 5-oxoprolinase subunit PxpB [Rhodospirillales bacterium]